MYQPGGFAADPGPVNLSADCTAFLPLAGDFAGDFPGDFEETNS